MFWKGTVVAFWVVALLAILSAGFVVLCVALTLLGRVTDHAVNFILSIF